MDYKILKNEKDELIIEFETLDLTVPDFIANYLLNNPNVKFAGVQKNHPEIDKPKLVIKTNGSKSAAELLKASIKDLKSELSEFKGKFN